MLNGSIPARTKETDKCHRHQRTATGTNDRRKHFMNYCLTHSGKFSFAVDSFLELDYAILKDFIRHIARNEFFEVSQNLFASEIDMAAIREPVWAYSRYQCTPNFIIFQKNCFSLFQTDLIAIFHFKKKSCEKRLILRKVVSEKRFLR